LQELVWLPSPSQPPLALQRASLLLHLGYVLYRQPATRHYHLQNCHLSQHQQAAGCPKGCCLASSAGCPHPPKDLREPAVLLVLLLLLLPLKLLLCLLQVPWQQQQHTAMASAAAGCSRG
jgi:hypothetical protein